MWAVVEIMGHRVRAGRVSDAVIGGATMLQVQHPSRRCGDDPLIEFYSPQAIFAIRPCLEEEAVAVARTYWPERVEQPALSPAFADRMDDDECPF